MPGLTRTANGGHATVAVDCRDSRTSYPRRNASGHRCARRRVSTGPVTKRCYTPVRPHGPPVGTNPSRTVGTGQEAHPAQGPSQVREVNSTSVERTALWHSGCRCAVLPCMLPLRQPSLLLQLGWPQIPLVVNYGSYVNTPFSGVGAPRYYPGGRSPPSHRKKRDVRRR
jgi:hypothetical protein